MDGWNRMKIQSMVNTMVKNKFHNDLKCLENGYYANPVVHNGSCNGDACHKILVRMDPKNMREPSRRSKSYHMTEAIPRHTTPYDNLYLQQKEHEGDVRNQTGIPKNRRSLAIRFSTEKPYRVH